MSEIFTPYGLEDGLDGLDKNVELVAETRAAVGDDVELMFDYWRSMDEEYIVRLAEELRPYKLKWIEDYVMPDNLVHDGVNTTAVNKLRVQSDSGQSDSGQSDSGQSDSGQLDSRTVDSRTVDSRTVDSRTVDSRTNSWRYWLT